MLYAKLIGARAGPNAEWQNARKSAERPKKVLTGFCQGDLADGPAIPPPGFEALPTMIE